MSDTFIIKSRYGIPREVTVVDKAKGMYTISGASSFMRGAMGMVDFEGGPFILIGCDFLGLGLVTHVEQIASRNSDAMVIVTVSNVETSEANDNNEQFRNGSMK